MGVVPIGINVIEINFRTYIDKIQCEIGKTLLEVGKGETEEEREKGRERLQALLLIQSKRLSSELGLSGDYNIVFMLTIGMIAIAWATFIIKAKSLDGRRPEKDRSIMKAMADNMLNSIQEIVRQAISYGEIYDKEKNP